MTGKSVARQERERASTASIVADEALVKQIARALFCPEEPLMDAFLGEPVEMVLAMVRWAMEHEADPGFDPAKALPNWAKRRQRGAYRPDGEPRRYQQCRECGGRFRAETMAEDGLCKTCERDGGPSEAEREVAAAIGRYWSKHPEELARVLREVRAEGNGA